MKQKLLKVVAVVAIAVGALELAGNIAAIVAVRYLSAAISRGDSATIGIIGGADGPTAVFVTGPGLEGWLIPLALVAVGTLGLYGLKKCNK